MKKKSMLQTVMNPSPLAMVVVLNLITLSLILTLLLNNDPKPVSHTELSNLAGILALIMLLDANKKLILSGAKSLHKKAKKLYKQIKSKAKKQLKQLKKGLK